MTSLPPFHLHGPNAADLEPGTWLLEASAGTGKTYTIVGIIIRLLAETELTIEQCIVMTFTRAATSELRERIRAGLHAALAVLDLEQHDTIDDDFLLAFYHQHKANASAAHTKSVQDQLLLAVASLDGAVISTIHGVCHRLLADHAVNVGLAIGAELDADADAWRQATVHDILRQWTRSLSDDVAGLVGDAFHPDRLIESCAYLERYPLVQLVGVDELQPHELRDLLQLVRQQWSVWRKDICDFYQQRSTIIGAVAAYTPRSLQQLCDRIEQEINGRPVRSILSELLPVILKPNQDVERLSRAHIKQLRQKPWYKGFGQLLNIEQRVRRSVVARYREKLQARAHDSRHLHFNDLLMALHEAATGSQAQALQQAVRQQFRCVLVDEFQDTDPLQWRILSQLFRGPTQRLFVIGDPKQAIYAFRGADVHAYLEVAALPDLRAYTLNTNYRSDADLVAATNALFDRGSTSFAQTGINFHPVQAVKANRFRWREAPGSPLAQQAPLTIWWDDGDGNADALRQRTAAAVASEISVLLAYGERKQGEQWQPIRPRDIAVLVRSHSEGDTIATAIAALPQALNCVRNVRHSVFSSRTAFDIMTVLCGILAPHRERSVRAAAFTRLSGGTGSRLRNDQSFVNSVIVRLRRLREIWFDRGFVPMWQDFLQHGCGGTPPRITLAAQWDGERALTDLLHIGDLLVVEERESGLGPDALCDWLQIHVHSPSNSDAELLRLDRDDDAVRILTIHASKGLQFPIVFSPFLWRSQKLDDEVLYHQDCNNYWRFGPSKQSLEAIRRQETLAESIRLAYVALTRAEHRSYISMVPQKPYAGYSGCTESALAWLGSGVGQCEPSALGVHLQACLNRDDWPQQWRTSMAGVHTHIGLLPDQKPTTWPEPSHETHAHKTIAPWHELHRQRHFSSYSGLIRNRPVDEPDYDQIRAAPAIAPAALPRGPRFGTALHAVFEFTPFDASTERLLEACSEQLTLHGYDSSFAPAMAQVIRQTLASTPPGFQQTLAIAAATAMAEMDVLLPARDTRSIAQAFRDHGGQWAAYADDLSGIQIPSGYFTGIIDLVFWHQGRMHVLDWKSNDLAERGGYGFEALKREMHHHHYVLQYHLYLVALHRYLQLRLPHYSMQQHLGSAFYGFVRGIDAHNGWYVDRPSDAMILALDACFGTRVTLPDSVDA